MPISYSLYSHKGGHTQARKTLLRFAGGTLLNFKFPSLSLAQGGHEHCTIVNQMIPMN